MGSEKMLLKNEPKCFGKLIKNYVEAVLVQQDGGSLKSLRALFTLKTISRIFLELSEI